MIAPLRLGITLSIVCRSELLRRLAVEKQTARGFRLAHHRPTVHLAQNPPKFVNLDGVRSRRHAIAKAGRRLPDELGPFFLKTAAPENAAPAGCLNFSCHSLSG